MSLGTSPLTFEGPPAPRPLRPADPAPAAEASTLVRAAGLAVAAAVAVAVLVFVVSHLLPATYQSSALFRVTVPNQQGINDSVVTAADDLATQYAQLADSDPVVRGAAAKLQVSPSSLSGQISGSTVSGQNIVQITASSSSRAVAEQRAKAAVTAMVSYLDSLNAQQGLDYAGNAEKYLAPINQTLKELTANVGKRGNIDSVLTAILEQRQQALASLATDAAAGEPNLQVISDGSAASQSFPKPALYALIAFVIALVIGARVAYVVTRRSVRRAPARLAAAA